MDKNLNDGSISVENKDTKQPMNHEQLSLELLVLEESLKELIYKHCDLVDEDGDPLLGGLYVRGMYTPGDDKLKSNGFLCGGSVAAMHALANAIMANDTLRSFVSDALSIAAKRTSNAQ